MYADANTVAERYNLSDPNHTARPQASPVSTSALTPATRSFTRHSVVGAVSTITNNIS